MWGSQSQLESNNDSMAWQAFETGPSPILNIELARMNVTWSDSKRLKATHCHEPI